jgi:hypothetical protein
VGENTPMDDTTQEIKDNLRRIQEDCKLYWSARFIELLKTHCSDQYPGGYDYRKIVEEYTAWALEEEDKFLERAKERGWFHGNNK